MSDEARFVVDLLKIMGIALWVPFSSFLIASCKTGKTIELFNLPVIIGLAAAGTGILYLGYIIIKRKWRL